MFTFDKLATCFMPTTILATTSDVDRTDNAHATTNTETRISRASPSSVSICVGYMSTKSATVQIGLPSRVAARSLSPATVVGTTTGIAVIALSVGCRGRLVNLG